MINRWNDKEAAQFQSDLAQRVYTSRLLGQDPSLVLHGGGNTSVKSTSVNLFGEEEEILYVKGSGWDLATIEEPGFSPVRMEPVLKMAKLETLSDPAMANALRTSMTDASAPSPSVETVLHAILPFKFVDHTHADAIISVTNNARGEERVREIYGEQVVIIPYVMPGFKLARLCAERYPQHATEKTIGMVLLNHGLFSFGETAKESYERMIDLVQMAEDYLAAQDAWLIPVSEAAPPSAEKRTEIATLRREISAAAGAPMIVSTHDDPQVRHFLQQPGVERFAQQGPATPDHVLRTKRIPMMGRDVAAYGQAYADYFEQHAPDADQDLTMLDPAPRLVLDSDLGFCTVGQTKKAADIAEDIYRHTMEIILRAEALGGYEALPPGDIFDVEYWDLEQAKLQKKGASPVFSGEVALVTGAASGIGLACARAMLDRGAAVIGLDLSPAVATTFDQPNFLGLVCDITNLEQVRTSLEAGVKRFGGVDMLVLNAGIFSPNRLIREMPDDEWRKVLGINLDANMAILREVHPLLTLAPKGGRVVLMGSKNVPAPGPGAVAYSASKAALTQMGRVAAMEWGGDGIRVNVLHPNAVFDTALWTSDVLAARAKHYGMSIDEYKRNNILGVEVTDADVGNMVAELCGPLFAKTTGAQIPIDGGNDRVI